MSAQLRYRTLVRNIGRIYAAPKDTRMDLLQTGLDEIVAIVGPNGADSWNTVGSDSERLLKVWVAKESDDPAALEVAQQLTDILWELAAEKDVPMSPSSSTISFKETPSAPMNTPAHETMSRPVADSITHIQHLNLIESSPALVVKEVTIVTADEEGEVEESDEEDIAVTTPEEEEVDEEGEVDESDEEAEVLEPPEDEEEEGMSVEQITIRGRTYWRDTDTDDLYAVVGEDDVGDKVGQIINGTARFFPPAK